MISAMTAQDLQVLSLWSMVIITQSVMRLTGQQHAAVRGSPDQSKSLSCSCSGVSVLFCGSAKTMQVEKLE